MMCVSGSLTISRRVWENKLRRYFPTCVLSTGGSHDTGSHCRFLILSIVLKSVSTTSESILSSTRLNMEIIQRQHVC